MKKRVLIILIMIMPIVAFAQAPELKNMMPNSWEKLTRLSEQEENDLLADNIIKQNFEERKKYYNKKTNNKIDVRVYSENCNGLNFYRILYCNEVLDTFLNTEYKNCTITQEEYEYMQDIELLQSLFVKEKNNNLRFIGGTSYHKYWVSQGKWEGFNFSDIMIKPMNKNEIGFFVTEAIVSFIIERITEDKMNVVYRKVKNQQVGYSKTYFGKNNVNGEIKNTINHDSIKIESSDYLFDPKCPFKYSIQNAFDGNPATSYVENTEDDLFILDIGTGGKDVTKLAIINGYAQNEKLYTENNRIKKIGKNKVLTDNQLTYQILPCLGSYLTITDLYNGVKYNDTCVAEVNLEINGKWFYGDLDE